MGIRDENDSQLLAAIPITGTSCRTGIDNNTLLVKFQTFYLKLTYDEANDGYRLEAYLYNTSIPELNLVVPRLSIKEFLGQFTDDNYLNQQFRITWPITHDRNRYH